MGKFASFNWIAVDLKGRYNITDHIASYINLPLALKKPDMDFGSGKPEWFGGVSARGEAGFGKTLGIGLTLGVMRQGAMLLSEKDYPYFHGDLAFGTAVGPYVRFKMLGLNINTTPSYVYQDGTGSALQVPLSAMIKLGSLLEVATETGVFTGSNFNMSAADGGRIYLGASITAKIWHIVGHLGAGVASLLVSDAPTAEYHSIGDSVYVDVNVKYAK